MSILHDSEQAAHWLKLAADESDMQSPVSARPGIADYHIAKTHDIGDAERRQAETDCQLD